MKENLKHAAGSLTPLLHIELGNGQSLSVSLPKGSTLPSPPVLLSVLTAYSELRKWLMDAEEENEDWLASDELLKLTAHNPPKSLATGKKAEPMLRVISILISDLEELYDVQRGRSGKGKQP